jgi:hypothetical protein
MMNHFCFSNFLFCFENRPFLICSCCSSYTSYNWNSACYRLYHFCKHFSVAYVESSTDEIYWSLHLIQLVCGQTFFSKLYFKWLSILFFPECNERYKLTACFTLFTLVLILKLHAGSVYPTDYGGNASKQDGGSSGRDYNSWPPEYEDFNLSEI